MRRASCQLLLVILISLLATSSRAGHPDATLLAAAREGDLLDAAVSLEHGGNLDAHYDFSDGLTPLMIAAREGHAEFVAMLLSRGADPGLTLQSPGRRQHGWNAHDFARDSGQAAAAAAIERFEEGRRERLQRAGGTVEFSRRMVEAARERTRHRVTYDGRYRKIDYPNGDVPADVGVCTDVVIRAYRALGIDLQSELHEEMKASFEAFPSLWGLRRPDPNIDHRRVPNLQTFFARRGRERPVTNLGSDYLPGDLVTWLVDGRLPHIGIVDRMKTADGERPLIVHNIGRGPQLEDMLFDYPITGHYRYEGRN